MDFTLTTRVKASAKEIYEAWLDSEGHTKMTGGEASISDKLNESFTAWDGYIEGKNLALEPHKRIVQSWRTSEFEEGEEDSQIELLLREVKGYTELALVHTKLPADGEHYIKGWKEHYFDPMKNYFST